VVIVKKTMGQRNGKEGTNAGRLGRVRVDLRTGGCNWRRASGKGKKKLGDQIKDTDFWTPCAR